MASLIEAIDIKRKMFFEFEGAPYHCIDVRCRGPTARGGQTLVRLKMRNLLTRAVFDKTFKAGEKFSEPDLVGQGHLPLWRHQGYHFMDQESFETVTLTATVGDDRLLLVDNLLVQIRSTTATRSACSCRRTSSSPSPTPNPAVRGDTASGGVTKAATLETGLEMRVPLFVKEGEG